MKTLLLIFATTLALAAQATFTPPVPPTGAVPGKLVAIAGTGASAISCTGIGDTVPAKAIVWNCSIAGVAGGPFTIPAAAGFIFHVGIGTTNLLDILTKPNAVAGIDVQATINGGPAVTGTF